MGKTGRPAAGGRPKKGTDTAPSPAELRGLIRATLGHYFPHCEHASLAFVPGPGMPPLELVVSGDVLGTVGISDEWFFRAGTAWWEPTRGGAE